MGIVGKRRLSKLILFTIAGLMFILQAGAKQTDNSDVVVLEHTKLVTNITAHEKALQEKTANAEAEAVQVTPQNIHEYLHRNPDDVKFFSFEKEEQAGDFSYGLKYDASVKPEEYNQKGTIFTRYKKNKLSVDTSLSNENFASWPQRGQGTLSFSPEYKLNDRLSVQNIYSTNFLERNKKSEFVFSIKPFKDDRVNLNFGASQVMYSESVRPPRSQLNFSTMFKL